MTAVWITTGVALAACWLLALLVVAVTYVLGPRRAVRQESQRRQAERRLQRLTYDTVLSMLHETRQQVSQTTQSPTGRQS